MVDESPAPRPHTALPMAPHLQRSMRLRRALHLKQPVKPPASRTTQRSWRRRFKGNVFTFVFMAGQLLIAVAAFVLVRDYMDDGYITHAVTNILNQVAGESNEPKIDRDAAIAVKPPPASDEIINKEIAAVQKTLTTIEPLKTPPAETSEKLVAAAPPAKEQATAPAVEPESVAPPVAQVATPAIAPEPVPPPVPQVATPAIAPEPVPPPVAQVATPAVKPEAAPKATEQVVALAPIPDLTPLKDVPAVPVPSQSTKPQQTEGQAFRDCATCPELVPVSPGRFMMGAGSKGSEQQVSVTPAQDVAITAPFAIGRNEITFDEWSQCVGDGGCTSEPADENWGRGRRPVINVSFNDITQQYLPWLSRKTGFTYRLPTEAEWEFAARGGATAPAGQAYSFGDDSSLLCEYGNSSDLAAKTTEANWTGINCNDGYAATAPAGSLKPNGLGLFDMHGNVWEWVADCWQPQYSAKPAKQADACDSRVLRGGSWASDAAALRTAVRGWERQDRSKNSIGFRVARSQP